MPDPVFSLINCFASTALDHVTAALSDQGFAVVRFDGDGVTDKASFLERADRDLPRPADLHPHNWDALNDTLWNGLDDLGQPAIAIVWTDAQQMVAGDLQDFLTAVDIMAGVARSVDASVLLVFIGDGPAFRRWPGPEQNGPGNRLVIGR